MQHIGDLQPFEPPAYMTDRAPLGRYSAKRSRWRFAVGSLEVGFDRASEQLHAETPRPARDAVRPDFGRQLMVFIGMLTTSALIVAVAGWLWSTRGAATFGGETVAAAIVDRSGEAASAGKLGPAAGNPIVIPTKAQQPRLAAMIEQRQPAPAFAPAPRAALPIAEGRAIQPKPAPEAGRLQSAPDEAIVSSGNYLLIPSVAAAVSQAMASGEAQNWEAGNYHGLVVVGDANMRDGKACRQGTVLLRDGSTEGHTQKFERCA